MDVKSLYTIIPHKDGLNALKYYLNKRVIKDPPTDTILRLAELILTLNSFTVSDKYYRKTSRVAMGTKFGPSYANLFLGKIEEQLADSYKEQKPVLYLRYIDDIFGIAQMKENELRSWMAFFENLHPSVEFTSSISQSSVVFLDATISIENNSISTNVHFKPTDSHSYLLYNSFHPKKCKDSIPFSQILRLRKLTSNNQQFETNVQDLLQFFKIREYPSAILESAKEKAKSYTQEKLLSTKGDHEKRTQLPFVTRYHPQINKVYQVLRNNWKMLQEDSTLFDQLPLLSTRRNKNIRDLLVHTRCAENSKVRGAFPCGRNRCITCNHTCEAQEINGPDSKWIIPSAYTCVSTNLVYFIKCLKCDKLYIGETKRMLSERFREHRRHIVKHFTSSPVAQHFTSSGHNLSDLKVGVMAECSSDRQRKTFEMRLINRLGTLDPKGINIDFTYNI